MKFSPEIEVRTTRKWLILDADLDLAEVTVEACAFNGTIRTEVHFGTREELAPADLALVVKAEAEAREWLGDQPLPKWMRRGETGPPDRG